MFSFCSIEYAHKKWIRAKEYINFGIFTSNERKIERKIFRFANCESNPEIKNVDCKHDKQTEITFTSTRTASMKIEDEFYYFLRSFLIIHSYIFIREFLIERVAFHLIEYDMSLAEPYVNGIMYAERIFTLDLLWERCKLTCKSPYLTENANKTIRGRIHDGNIRALLFNKITAHCIIGLSDRFIICYQRIYK